MANTTNFGWETPDDTDLVKDGAAAMRTLGNSIDTSFVDLKGGTTGQVLAKATNADLDFTWTNGGDITAVTAGTGISGGGTSGDVTITNSMATAIDAKGDLIAGTAADAFSRLAVGANDTVLTADSSTATGLKWASAPSPTLTWTLLNTGGTTLTGASVTISSITNDELMIVIDQVSTSAGSGVSMRVNSNSSSIYNMRGGRVYGDSTYSNNIIQCGLGLDDGLHIIRIGTNYSYTADAYIRISGCKSSTTNKMFWGSGGPAGSGTGGEQTNLGGNIATNTAVTSVTIYGRGGNLDAGTVYIYGAN